MKMFFWVLATLFSLHFNVKANGCVDTFNKGTFSEGNNFQQEEEVTAVKFRVYAFFGGVVSPGCFLVHIVITNDSGPSGEVVVATGTVKVGDCQGQNISGDDLIIYSSSNRKAWVSSTSSTAGNSSMIANLKNYLIVNPEMQVEVADAAYEKVPG